MNIEKVKNYNQVMLSVIATAGVAIAVIGLISFVFFLLNDVFSVFQRSSQSTETGIPTAENYADESSKKMDKLYITYNFPEIIDSANQVYIIPIGHRTNQEIRDQYSRFSFSSGSSYGYSSDSKYYNDNYTYVNMMVYDAKNAKTEILFKQKILIIEYSTEHFKDDAFLLMEAALDDTNKDGQISSEDLTSLFIYSVRTGILKHLEYKDKSVLYFKNIPGTKNFMVKFGIDAARQYENNSNSDMSVLCKYLYDMDQLQVINDENTQKELNSILDKK